MMKLKRLIDKLGTTKHFAFLVGFLATIWFLIRVIPKPSRAHYPCMRIAAPLMSTFVIYLLGVTGTVFSFKKLKSSIRDSKYVLSLGFIVLMLFSASMFLISNPDEAIANTFNPVDNTFPVNSNDPVGTAIGLFPGRVAWAHNPGATNEYYDPSNAGNDWWYSDVNVDEAVVEGMLGAALLSYTEEESLSEAWNSLFVAFNEDHGRGAVGYTSGEKIAIKINLTNQCCSSEERMDATPQLINAILHQLTVHAGVAITDITLGDPYREFRSEYKQIVAKAYPGIQLVDGRGSSGVSQTVPSATEVLVFSDGLHKSTLPQHYLDATYFINIPCLKTHDEGGITLIAKNHQGSYLALGEDPKSQYAVAMHYSLPKNSSGQGRYRHTVDYMGHEELWGKGLIYIVDGIWGGESWEGWIKKFKSDPFNNDYPNSILLGQDPVALESVCYDILFEEYVQDDTKENYPIRMKAEISDYLLQCASSDYWPEGLTYDPEGDGTPIGSLGVFEHWNNPVDRKYSRNLGSGEGVELVYTTDLFNEIHPEVFLDKTGFSPNPFSGFTVFNSEVLIGENVLIGVYNMSGKLVRELQCSGKEIVWDGCDESGKFLPGGVYVYRSSEISGHGSVAGKIIINR